MISLQDRKNAVNLIEQTMEQGARQLAACQVLGLSVRTFQRWKQEDNVKVDGRKTANRPAPANKLTESCTKIRQLMCLGVEIRMVVGCGRSSKGPWRSAKTPGINQALSLAYLKSQGLYSLREGWIKLHHS
ncbi:hypothetical protein GZ78_14590 [Endozoicomonas numazuensis]|uniref:Transposase n=1 Tax=Endozoicomonas numazuensis TaxID=1137799 RepID=A0A081NF79_9GAMM|nr:hypothetical protein GZ78_14590 [Endozoicomonas numazuensis]